VCDVLEDSEVGVNAGAILANGKVAAVTIRSKWLSADIGWRLASTAVSAVPRWCSSGARVPLIL
jgi:hypothetical protein